MSDCLFCKIIAGQIPSHKLYENDNVFVFLDIGPVSIGHTLIVPKNHAENLAVGTSDDAQALMDALYELAPKIVKALGADGYNLGMNHGIAAGQDVLHTHLHVMPRKNGEVRTFVKQHPSQDELTKVAEQIRAGL